LTSKELRAEWDAKIEQELHPKMLQLGFSKRGKGWCKTNASQDKVGLIDFERKCLKAHLQIRCYAHVWISHRRQDKFGMANGTLAGELEPRDWAIPNVEAIESSLREVTDYLLSFGVLEIERVLDSGQPDHAGVRIGRLEELGSGQH
jgi:hypothetical protein